MGRPRRATPPENWKRWYDLAVWRSKRAAQLREHPLCQHCFQQGLIVPATVVDHIQPHRGSWNAFILGKLQSLCVDHHNNKRWHDNPRTKAPRFQQIGLDGYPVADNDADSGAAR